MHTLLGTFDLGGDGRTILLALINLQLGASFTLDKFVMSDPYVPEEAFPPHNTAIDLIPHAASGFYGSRKFYYDRINIAEIGNISLNYIGPATVQDALPTLNQAFGILLTASDIVNHLLVDNGVSDPTGKSAILEISPSCPVFYGTAPIRTGPEPTVPAPTPAPPTYTQTVWETLDW